MRAEYQDILYHSHHISRKRHPMPMHDRAAQFAPFSALTAFDEQIGETARLTDIQTELGEDDIRDLNEALKHLLEMEAEKPKVKIEYFQPDSKKSGGAYVSFIGNFRFFDEANRKLKFTDGTIISVDTISRIDFAE